MNQENKKTQPGTSQKKDMSHLKATQHIKYGNSSMLHSASIESSKLCSEDCTAESPPEADESVIENENAEVETETDAGWSVVQRNGKAATTQAPVHETSPSSSGNQTDKEGNVPISPSRYDAMKTISEEDEEEGEILESDEENSKAEVAGLNLEAPKHMFGGGSQTRSKSNKKKLSNRAVSNNFPITNKIKRASSGKH